MAIVDVYGGEVVTDEAGLRKWGEEKAFIIGARMGHQSWFANPTYSQRLQQFKNDFLTDNNRLSCIPARFNKPDLLGTGYGDLPSDPLRIIKSFQSYDKTARMCGVVTGHNTDGSLRIRVYGNQILSGGKNFQRTLQYYIRQYYVPIKFEPYPVSKCMFSQANPVYGFNGNAYFGAYTSTPTNPESQISEASANNVVTDGFQNGYGNNFIRFHGKYWGRDFGDLYDNGFPTPTNDIQLTTVSGETLELGIPIQNAYYAPYNENLPEYWGGRLEENIDGNLYLYCYNSIKLIATANDTLVDYTLFDNVGYLTIPAGGTSTVQGEYAQMWKPYNLILTESDTEAKRYIQDGTLPSDAILYPFDENNMSSTDGSTSGDEGGGDPSTGEDGQSRRIWIDTPPSKPDVTPLMVSNNNYYWMQINELNAFMDWFWNNAGDLMDANDLWQSIQGLYANLNEAILRVRYMPVFENFLGETEAVTKVNVGQIAHIQKTKAFKKSVGADVQTIGEHDLPITGKYGLFTDFAPYCNVSLYLPLYGFIDLDTNILMGEKIRVQASYDIITGTIQYFISAHYKGQWLTINTVTAKCNVDIPITLQSKADSDGAILSNIGRIGQALTSVAVNPSSAIGTTLGLAGFQSQADSPAMSVRGGMGETGSFYCYPYCFLLIKKPCYVKPANYSSKVGFPCNGQYKLEKIHGYTECFNPYVKFTHMKVNDNDIQPPKPTAEEIETIYNALTDGVILP